MLGKNNHFLLFLAISLAIIHTNCEDFEYNLSRGNLP